MDNKTLKALVIEYKDNENMTFQAIADKLASEYNVIRSRQALQGMYQRAIKKNEGEQQKERLIASADIINIYCLGYKMADTRHIVNEFGYNLSYNDVVTTINEQQDYIADVKRYIVTKLSAEINKKTPIKDIRTQLIYKGISPMDRQLKNYIAEAYKIILESNMRKLLAGVYEFTEDKEIVKKIVKDMGVNIDICTIKCQPE